MIPSPAFERLRGAGRAAKRIASLTITNPPADNSARPRSSDQGAPRVVQASPEARVHERARPWPGGERIVRVAAFLWTLFLLCLAVADRGGSMLADVPLWDFQDSRRLAGLFVDLGLAAFAVVVRFGVATFLFTQVFASPRYRCGRRRSGALAIVLGSVLAVALRLVEIVPAVGLFSWLDVILPLAGCLLGAWVGCAWLRGARARLLVVPKLAGLVFAFGVVAGFVVYGALEGDPLPFEAERMTSVEKARLYELLRAANPRAVIPGRTRTLRLTQRDIDLLLTWGLSLGSPGRKARVVLSDDTVALKASLQVPVPAARPRHLNILVQTRITFDGCTLQVLGDELRVGRVVLPQWLLRHVSPAITARILADRRVKPFLDAIDRLRIAPGFVEATYGRIESLADLRDGVFGSLGPRSEVRAAVSVYVRHLLEQGRSLPVGDARFGACLESVFRLARDRSADGSAVIENRAAILAMGILLGHSRLADFVGRVTDDTIRPGAFRAFDEVTVRGRADWTRHFFVSAAVLVLSTESVTVEVGLLKEELDAVRGERIGRSSGFSFTDRLADEAGTRFAMAATRNEPSARAMQQRLEAGFRVDDFFPPADDLPEEIPESELQRRFGGVGGEGYRRVMDEIERRVAACSAYR